MGIPPAEPPPPALPLWWDHLIEPEKSARVMEVPWGQRPQVQAQGLAWGKRPGWFLGCVGGWVSAWGHSSKHCAPGRTEHSCSCSRKGWDSE